MSENKMTRVLVTGADGLLGSSVVRELLDGGFAVRVLLHPASASPTLKGLPVETCYRDLAAEDVDLDGPVRGCRYVIHCAAITNLWASSAVTWAVNLTATERLLDACEAADIERLVFVGSANIFEPGPGGEPADERAPFPSAYRGMDYMESKRRATECVRERVRAGRVDAVIVAPTFMLGEHDAGPSSGELLVQYLRAPVPVVTSGGRCFVNARDVARATVAALERGRPGETYILGGENLTYGEFFTRLAELGEAPAPRWTLPAALPAVAARLARLLGGRPTSLRVVGLAALESYYASDKARADLGFETEPLEVGMRAAIHGLKTYGHLEA